MLRIIPVLDVLGGLAVHAVGGRRHDYRPVRSAWRRGSDPIALAAAVRDAFGSAEVYLADLDAIAGKAPDLVLCRGLAALGLAAWVDAGLVDGTGVPALLGAGAARAVVGLETVAGPSGLADAIGAAGPGRLAFSLDLRDGRPIVAPGADWGTAEPRAIAARAVGLGVSAMIVLDLARVGTGRGVGTLDLVGRLAGEFPGVDWVVGGGVAGPGDLVAIERAGASAALVASALHDGRIGPGDVRGLESGR